jgi:hypothetical protein
MATHSKYWSWCHTKVLLVIGCLHMGAGPAYNNSRICWAGNLIHVLLISLFWMHFFQINGFHSNGLERIDIPHHSGNIHMHHKNPMQAIFLSTSKDPITRTQAGWVGVFVMYEVLILFFNDTLQAKSNRQRTKETNKGTKKQEGCLPHCHSVPSACLYLNYPIKNAHTDPGQGQQGYLVGDPRFTLMDLMKCSSI